MKAFMLAIAICSALLASAQGSSCNNAYILLLDSVCRNYPVSAVTSSCVFCTMSGYNGNNGRVTYFQFTTDSDPKCVLIEVTASINVTMELVLYSECNTGVPGPAGGLYNHNMCMNEGNGIWAQNLFDNLIPNTTYYLKARTAGGYTGDLQVCAKYYSPPNMACEGASSISSNVFVEDNNACNRPGSVPPGQLCAITLENTAWYTYVIQATGSTTITIDNILCNNGNGNNNNGFQIGFFTGDCNNLIPITCSNGAGGTVQATATGLTGGTRVYVAIDGYSGSNCSYTITATNSYPLPVKIKQFVAWKEGDRNILKWITLSEDQNSHFEVQRSPDGKHFEEIGRVQGQNSSGTEKEYILTDHFPLIASYYRLKQVDLDGKYSYSSVIEVKRKSGLSFELLPLPFVRDNISFNVLSSKSGRALLNLFSIKGELLFEEWVFLSRGQNNFTKKWNCPNTGSFILSLTMDNEKAARIFIKPGK